MRLIHWNYIGLFLLLLMLFYFCMYKSYIPSNISDGFFFVYILWWTLAFRDVNQTGKTRHVHCCCCCRPLIGFWRPFKRTRADHSDIIFLCWPSCRSLSTMFDQPHNKTTYIYKYALFGFSSPYLYSLPHKLNSSSSSSVSIFVSFWLLTTPL